MRKTTKRQIKALRNALRRGRLSHVMRCSASSWQKTEFRNANKGRRIGPDPRVTITGPGGLRHKTDTPRESEYSYRNGRRSNR